METGDKEAVAGVQVRDDDDSDQGSRSAHGAKWSQYVLNESNQSDFLTGGDHLSSEYD